MQYYSRTTQRTIPNGSFPGTSFSPDGALQLAMPVRTAPERSDTGGTGSGAGMVGDTVVLMQPPARPNEDSPTRSPLLFLILLDTASLVALLFELRWRKIFVGSTLSTGIAGLTIDAVGALGCWRRMHSLLGLFAIAAFMQFCGNALALRSLAQLMHTAMQPLLLRSALALRRSLVPTWYTHRSHGPG
jgi:hypothetical protein